MGLRQWGFRRKELTFQYLEIQMKELKLNLVVWPSENILRAETNLKLTGQPKDNTKGLSV